MFTNFLFYASFILAGLGALNVVFTKNLMHACVSLLAALFGIAGLYACLGADFLAATQLVVYAGGVIILMLFAVMLTGGSKDQVNKYDIRKIPSMGNKTTYGFAFFSVVVISLTIIKIIKNVLGAYQKTELPPFESTVEKIGTLLVTDHVLAFEISSVLLLGALVGAAVISRPKHRNILSALEESDEKESH